MGKELFVMDASQYFKQNALPDSLLLHSILFLLDIVTWQSNGLGVKCN